MERPVVQNVSYPAKNNGNEEILRELCACNGLNYQELMEEGRSNVTGLEMFFSGYPRIIGLNSFPHLQYLCIVDQNISKIENLCCPTLKELWISETKVGKIEGLSGLVELRKLYLYSNQIRRIENIDHLHKLEVLWLSSNDIEEIEGLATLLRLRELNLSNNRISSLGKTLLANGDLETLMLAGNRLCSLKDIKMLASLSNLRSLTLKDPTYPPTNGVSSLYNYAIYVLYHIPQLTLLDTYRVDSRQLKEFCESVITKKRSFYRMRLHALKRDYLQSVKFVERVRHPLVKACVDRLRLLQSHLQHLERKLSPKLDDAQLLSALHLTDVDNETIEKKVESVSKRVHHWNQVLDNVNQQFLAVVQDLHTVAVRKLRMLDLEWTTAGNIRTSESRSRSRSAPWLFAAVCNLVQSRFHAAEYASGARRAASCGHTSEERLIPTGIKVRSVVRVQNRYLQSRFHDSLFTHLQLSHVQTRQTSSSIADYALLPNEHVLKYKKYVNYLFAIGGGGGDYHGQVLEAMERGLQCDADQGVALTNSVFLADCTARERCWRCEQASRASRTLLVCRAYLGKYVTQTGTGALPQRRQFERDVTAVVRKTDCTHTGVERATCASQCACVCHEEPQKLASLMHDKCCEYVVFERNFVLPEYVVEYEYTFGGPQVDENAQDVYLHRLLRLVMQQAGLAEQNGAYVCAQSVLRELATQVAVEDSPYDHAESEQFDAKMITAYNILMRLAPPDVAAVFNSEFAQDSQTFALAPALLDASESVKQPLKVTKVNEESLGVLLGPTIKNKGFNSLTYLNLSAVGLTTLADVRTLTGLKVLIASCNELQRLDDVSHTHLEHLDVSFNRIATLEGLSAMHRLTYLNVCGNQLTRITNELLLLRHHAQNLKMLDLRCNLWLSNMQMYSLDVQTALNESSRQRKHSLVEFKRALRAKVIGWLRALTSLDGSPITEEENAAPKHGSGSVLSQACLLHHGRTDLQKRRALTLLTDAQQIAQLSSLMPERLHDQDVTWFGKITCLVVEGQSVAVLGNLERLTALRWASFERNDLIRIDSLDSACCEHLEELSLADNALTRVDELSRLLRLGSLSLSSNVISHIDPLTFSNWSNTLTYLALDSNRISTLRGFDRLTSLCELYVAHNQISNVRELFFLKPLSRLLILDVAYNPVCVEMENFRSFVIYHLRALKALNGQLVEQHEVNFSKELFGGRLTCDFISEKMALSSTDFTELTELDVPNQSLRTVDLGLNCTQTFSALRSVNLEHNNLTSFSGLIYLPNLKVLCLNYNKIDCIIPPTPTGAKTIPAGLDGASAPPIMERLEVLYLGSNQIRDLVALHLYRLPSLRSLFLHCNELTKLEGLEGLRNLRELVLDKNKLSSVPEQAFLTNWNLVELHIEDNRLKELQNLNSLEKLQRLYLGGNRVHGLTEIRKLDGLQNLLELSLFANPVTRHHDYRLCIIQRLQNLKVLDGLPINDDERLRAEMYLLEQQAMQQAAQTGTLEVLAPNSDLTLPSNGLVLGRNVSMPIKITNVHLFNMQQNVQMQAMGSQNGTMGQSGIQIGYPQLPMGVQLPNGSGNALEMNMIRKQQPATIKYNQPTRTNKQPSEAPNNSQGANGNGNSNGNAQQSSANSGKLSLAQRYQRVQSRIAALDNSRGSQYTNAQEEISRFLKNPRKE